MADQTDDVVPVELDDTGLDDTGLDDTGLDDTGLDDAAPDDELLDDDEAVPFDSGGGERELIATARRRHGALGGVVAAGMLGIDIALGRKPREEIPVVVDSPTEPVDIDSDGITVQLDEFTNVISPAIPRSAPKVAPTRRRRR
jgi:hypothetical protein